MTSFVFPYRERRPWQVLVAIFAIYLVLISYLALHHVMWRDEVRALSLAVQGRDIFDMFAGLRNEGHPLLWYLLLRISHDIFPSQVILPGLAWGIACASAYLIIFRSNFSPVFVIVFLLGRECLYEYSVMARNYGISMLLMFLWAACYRRHRDRGVVLGLLLLLLENCNVHSILLAGGLMLYWCIDLLNQSADRGRALRHLAVNALLFVCGLLLFFAVVRPTPNNVFTPHSFDWIHGMVNGVLHPGRAFSAMTGAWMLPEKPQIYWAASLEVTMSLLLIGSVLGLSRWRAIVPGMVALFGLSCMFMVIYPGSYRHVALWLVFLISLYWIEGTSQQNRRPSLRMGIGMGCLILILMFQIVLSLAEVSLRVNGYPESCAGALGQLVATDTNLQRAIIIAEPELLSDTLPYYVNNPIYLLREHKFGTWAAFSTSTVRDVSLSEIQVAADSLHRQTGRPVIVLLEHPLDESLAFSRYRDNFWVFTETRQQIAEFLHEFVKAQNFPSRRCTEESYDVYVMR